MNQPLFPELPVLVVDDKQDFLNSIDFALRANGITNLECCCSGLEVMSKLKEKKYSVILLDLGMPDVSGIDLLPKIVKQYPEISVIILTGTNEIDVAVDCIKNGATHFLVKPLDIEKLVTTIKEALCNDKVDHKTTD